MSLNHPRKAEHLLQPGRNCWRLARANRFALIIDAAEYFLALKAAMLRARQQILLIGWDFDARIPLDPDAQDGMPQKLGDFINALVDRKSDLQVRVLKWDFGMIRSLARGATPLFVLDWMTSSRIRLKLDSAHPAGASHHQKIAVIDDALAFCGGIDTTVGRWDTREHLDSDPRRSSPWGFAQDPWHDATAVVDGAAAAALGELARTRWRSATGEVLPRPAPGSEPWPASLAPLVETVTLGIARTQPAYKDQPQVSEIERLYFDVISAARRSLYFESQYIASQRIAEALCARLREENGPEIVIVTALSADGWLEEQVMGSARVLLVGQLREADEHGRLRLYTPVARGGTPIYVHAKIMIADERFLRVGSSNLNNRSMGLDTECDLAFEAVAGETDAARISAAIRRVRDDLLAEHLEQRIEAIGEALDAAGGSLIGAIESLRKDKGRSLRLFEPPPLGAIEAEMARSRLLDPERPGRFFKNLRQFGRGFA